MSDSESRLSFFRQAQGKFLTIFRLKAGLSVEEVAIQNNISVNVLHDIEAGESRVEDRVFFQLCSFLKASNEVGIFLKKEEEARDSKLFESRKDLAPTLARIGIFFSDKEKYNKNGRGVLLQMPIKKSK